MDLLKKRLDIARLIAEELTGTIDEKDRVVLARWLDEDERHREEYADKCVLVVSHGGAIHGMLNRLCFGGDVSRFWGERHMENCEVTTLEARDGKVTLLEEGKLYY